MKCAHGAIPTDKTIDHGGGLQQVIVCWFERHGDDSCISVVLEQIFLEFNVSMWCIHDQRQLIRGQMAPTISSSDAINDEFMLWEAQKSKEKKTRFSAAAGGLVCMTTNQSIAVAISHIRIKLCCSIQINAIQTASIRYSDIECTLWDDSVTDMLFDRAYAAALTPCKRHDKAAESSFVMNNSLENESINWPRYFIPYYRCCNTR